MKEFDGGSYNNLAERVRAAGKPGTRFTSAYNAFNSFADGSGRSGSMPPFTKSLYCPAASVSRNMFLRITILNSSSKGSRTDNSKKNEELEFSW